MAHLALQSMWHHATDAPTEQEELLVHADSDLSEWHSNNTQADHFATPSILCAETSASNKRLDSSKTICRHSQHKMSQRGQHCRYFNPRESACSVVRFLLVHDLEQRRLCSRGDTLRKSGRTTAFRNEWQTFSLTLSDLSGVRTCHARVFISSIIKKSNSVSHDGNTSHDCARFAIFERACMFLR